MLTVLTLLFTNTYQENSVDSLFFFLCRMGLLLCVFIIYNVLLQSLKALEKQITLGEQLIFERNLLQMQIEEQNKQSSF